MSKLSSHPLPAPGPNDDDDDSEQFQDEGVQIKVTQVLPWRRETGQGRRPAHLPPPRHPPARCGFSQLPARLPARAGARLPMPHRRHRHLQPAGRQALPPGYSTPAEREGGEGGHRVFPPAGRARRLHSSRCGGGAGFAPGSTGRLRRFQAHAPAVDPTATCPALAPTPPHHTQTNTHLDPSLLGQIFRHMDRCSYRKVLEDNGGVQKVEVAHEVGG